MSEAPSTAKDVFLAALEIPMPGQRAAFLHRACAGSPSLREEVGLLLRAHEEPDSLLDGPRIDMGLGFDPGQTLDQCKWNIREHVLGLTSCSSRSVKGGWA